MPRPGAGQIAAYLAVVVAIGVGVGYFLDYLDTVWIGAEWFRGLGAYNLHIAPFGPDRFLASGVGDELEFYAVLAVAGVALGAANRLLLQRGRQRALANLRALASAVPIVLLLLADLLVGQRFRGVAAFVASEVVVVAVPIVVGVVALTAQPGSLRRQGLAIVAVTGVVAIAVNMTLFYGAGDGILGELVALGALVIVIPCGLLAWFEGARFWLPKPPRPARASGASQLLPAATPALVPIYGADGSITGYAQAGGAVPGASFFGAWVRPSTNGFAVAGFVTGLIGAWVLGLIFGFVARSQIKQSGGAQRGGGLAIAGIVLSFVWLAAIIGVYVFVFAAANSSGY